MTLTSSGAGSSATDSRMLVEHQRLPTSGARAVHAFCLDGALRLAIPQLVSIRSERDSRASTRFGGRHEWRR